MCRRGPSGADDCPLKGSVQNAYLKQERHDCVLFKHFSRKQIEKRQARAVAAEVEQESLF